MTKVHITVVQNDVTSLIEGVGLKELRKVIKKMKDNLPWTLIVKSKATFTETKNPGIRWNPQEKVEK